MGKPTKLSKVHNDNDAEDDKPFSCDECDAKYCNPQGLSRHKSAVHKGKGTMQCNVCGKSFRKDNLKRHQNSCKSKELAKSEPPPAHECQRCKTKFASKFSLNRHIPNCNEIEKVQMLKKKRYVPTMASHENMFLHDGPLHAGEMLFLFAEIGLAEVRKHLTAAPGTERDSAGTPLPVDVDFMIVNDNSPAVFRDDDSQTEIPHDDFPTAIPCYDTPTAIPCDDTPTAIPCDEAPTAIPCDEAPTSIVNVDSLTTIVNGDSPTAVAHNDSLAAIPELMDDFPAAIPDENVLTAIIDYDSPTVIARNDSPTADNDVSTEEDDDDDAPTADDTRRRLLHRRYTKISNCIQKNIRKLSEEEASYVLRKALDKSKSYKLISKDVKPKPRGIQRTADDTIDLVWKFWNENATLSNAKTERPSSIPRASFENEPLLQRVNIKETDIVQVYDKRKIERYTHQDMVQNETDLDLFKQFKQEFPQIVMGPTTFKKIKPFYIRPCKPADLQTCCCKTHVNFRNAFEALIVVSKQYNNVFAKVHPDNNVTPVFQSYKSVMEFLYKDCKRDDFGLLVDRCESGQCQSWSSNFQIIKSHIERSKIQNLKGFVRFEYSEDHKLDLVQDPMTASEIVLYIENKLKKFVLHSNDCKRDYLLWKKWTAEFDRTVNPILVIDFSENLSLPIYKEPQSMYWIRKQVSILCGVGSFQAQDGTMQKIYFGHVSEDRNHDQGYILLSLSDALTVLPVRNTLILRSDNASNFKCAESFYDMQQLANKQSINVVRVYGAAGHSKHEVDSCGGHLKNPPRKHISKGNNLRSASHICEFLTNKYDSQKYCNPIYHLKEISGDDLETERDKRRYMRFDTVAGSDSFHVIIFRPNQDFFHASRHLCVCEKCLAMEFEKCSNFQKYIPSVGKLSKKQLRSTPAPPKIAEQAVSIVTNTVIAVRADNDLHNFFLVMCDEDQKVHDDPTTPLEDKFGHKILDGIAYVQGRYLDYSTMNNKCHIYTVSKSKVYVPVDAVFFPYVPIHDTTKSSFKIFNEIILELQVNSSS